MVRVIFALSPPRKPGFSLQSRLSLLLTNRRSKNDPAALSHPARGG
jgi:hypothetical protein